MNVRQIWEERFSDLRKFSIIFTLANILDLYLLLALVQTPTLALVKIEELKERKIFHKRFHHLFEISTPEMWLLLQNIFVRFKIFAEEIFIHTYVYTCACKVWWMHKCTSAILHMYVCVSVSCTCTGVYNFINNICAHLPHVWFKSLKFIVKYTKNTPAGI